MENNIEYLKEEVKIYERGILTLLLDISRSFSDESFTKKKRDEIFVKIDGLRDKVKDINKVIAELKQVEVDKKENFYDIKKVEVSESLKASVIEENNTNLKDVLESQDKIIAVIENEEEYTKEATSMDNEVVEDETSNEEFDTNSIQDIEEIDRLIEEAQNLNNNIIKFPESRRRIDNYENVELDPFKEKDEIKKEEMVVDEDIVEPVPVLFGNSRAQNQMIIRKKSSGFSDKLKSLIFKIKVMLGAEYEE